MLKIKSELLKNSTFYKKKNFMNNMQQINNSFINLMSFLFDN